MFEITARLFQLKVRKSPKSPLNGKVSHVVDVRSFFSPGVRPGNGQNQPQTLKETVMKDSIVESLVKRNEPSIKESIMKAISLMMFIILAIFAKSAPADDFGNSCSTATTVGINQNISAKLETASDVDYFKFILPERGVIRIYTNGSLDTFGYLYSSTCSLLASNDNDLAGLQSTLNFSISSERPAGTYIVQVKGKTSSTKGSYGIAIAFDNLAKFGWPTDTRFTNGHYGICGDNPGKSDGCYWLSSTSHDSSRYWRDASPFQRHPVYINGKLLGYHLGGDHNKDSDLGQYVWPASGGVVTGVYEKACGWGNVVTIRHKSPFGTYTTVYGHVTWLPGGKPKLGSVVLRDRPIAMVGTGKWTATATCGSSGQWSPHLHFETRRGDRPLIGPAYTLTKCNGSDGSTNNCPAQQLDPNKFIADHN